MSKWLFKNVLKFSKQSYYQIWLIKERDYSDPELDMLCGNQSIYGILSKIRTDLELA